MAKASTPISKTVSTVILSLWVRLVSVSRPLNFKQALPVREHNRQALRSITRRRAGEGEEGRQQVDVKREGQVPALFVDPSPAPCPSSETAAHKTRVVF